VTQLYDLANYQRMAGRYDVAIASFRTLLSLGPSRGATHFYFGATLLLKGDAPAALAALISKYEKDASYNIADVYAFCGDADKAFEWLDKAIAYHDSGLGEIVTENLFDKISRSVS
jgi:tetratricopeptide (TPR) repeat protein